MKKILLILSFLLPLLSYSQDRTNGIYYYLFFEGSVRLNLMADYKSLTTSVSRGCTYKYIGNWHIKNDTIIVIDYLVHTDYDSLKPTSDTSFYKILSPTVIKKVFSNFNFNFIYHKQIEYYDNGDIKLEIKNFWKYPLTGIITYFYPKGKIKEILNYKKGKKHGQYLKFSEQGILIISGTWKRDKEASDWLYYNNLGILEKLKYKNRE